MKIKIGDIVLIVFIVLFSVLLLLFLNGGISKKAIVEYNGEVIETLDLSKNATYNYDFQYHNSVEVKDGKIFVTYSDCPNNACVKTGEINKAGQVICCLPNKLIIRIVDDKEKVDVVVR